MTNQSVLTVESSKVNASNETIAEEKTSRLSTLDIQRGLIMVLMAYTHSLEYISVEFYNNADWNRPGFWQSSSLFSLLQQAFVSFIVAGGFFMMSGISVALLYQARMKAGWSEAKICEYLFKRGMLLVILQMTILQLFECLAESKIYIYLGVLMTLGFCMMLSGLTLYCVRQLKSILNIKYLEYLLPAALIICITVGMQLFVNYLQTNHITPTSLQTLFFITGHTQWGIDVSVNFSPIPWFPAVAAGLIVGQIMLDNKEICYRYVGIIAVTILISWVLLRTANVTGLFSFGEYKQFPTNETFNFSSYFAMSKYPPSIAFFLWTIGVNLLCIFGIHQIEKYQFKIVNTFLSPLIIFGQCSLFFFILHWFVYYGWSLLLGDKLNSIPGCMLIWILGLFILYPMCRAFQRFKFSKPKESIWRMF